MLTFAEFFAETVSAVFVDGDVTSKYAACQAAYAAAQVAAVSDV
jgi:hypothetical protein